MVRYTMACPEDFAAAQSRWDDMEPEDLLPEEETEEVEDVDPSEADAWDQLSFRRGGW